VPGTAEFHVAFVCTGNRFRSPLAAAVFTRATADLRVAIASCGTLDVGPLPPLREALVYGKSLGIDLSRHAARLLPPGGLHRADLVVGFERIHVVTAVMDGGVPLGRAFTLPELVPLVEAADSSAPDPLTRAREMVAQAAARREDEWLSDELEDPLGRPSRTQRQLAERVVALTERLVVALFGPAGD
jgi:protein-tyrosine phosphatase